MTLVTVPQVNPNDSVTAASVNQGPNALRDVVNGQLDDTNISTISGSKITGGTVPAAAFDPSTNPETRESEIYGDLVASGLVWSIVSGLNGSMTSGVAYVSGKRLTVSSIATYGFTASKDTYVYIDSNGNAQYDPEANGATQPATPANTMLIAKVITNGSAITSIEDLRVTGLSQPWRSWTPLLTNVTIGNGSIVGAQKQIGKTTFYRLKIIFGTTSSITGTIGFVPPVAPNSELYNAASEGYIVGTAKYLDAATAAYHGFVYATQANSFTLTAQNTSGAYAAQATVNASTPFGWGNTDQIIIQGFYEGA